MEFEQGDIVLCQVDRIIGTTVFVKIENSKEEGSIVFSEISPGRIRNIRDFVVPKKTIICKVLKNDGKNIELSLRRVNLKEKKERLEQHKLEKSYLSILKSILKEKTKKALEKIQEKTSLYNFLEESKENQEPLEEIVGKNNAEKIITILKSQKKKLAILKKQITLNTSKPDGLKKIKEIFSKIKKVDVRYIAAGKYLIKAQAKSPKEADNLIKKTLEEIENHSKEEKFNFLN